MRVTILTVITDTHQRQRRFKGVKYSETVDQPAMTRAMNLAQCRLRSPSFDKLCRDLQGRLEKNP